MEEKKETAARPSPWKCVRTVEHNGQSFQDILNESTQKAKEKELSGSVALRKLIGRRVHSGDDDGLERKSTLMAR